MDNFSTVRNLYRKNDFVKDGITKYNSAFKEEGGLKTEGYFKKSTQNNILISVITVVFNGKSSIENSIISVLKQDYDNVEYIIIDGGSTDGTLDIIKKYNSYIDYWVSEKDNGIGDAWNKGINFCNGIYIGILNADDIYSYSNLSTLNKLYIQDRNSNIVYYGNCFYIAEGRIIRSNFKLFNPDKIVNGINFAHTTCYISKDMYNKVGLFNITYRIAVDTEYILRVFKLGGEFKKGNLKTYMSVGGVSDRFFKKSQLEYTRALKELGLAELSSINKRIRYVKIYSFIRKLKSFTPYYLIKNFIIKLIPTFLGIIYSILPSYKLKTIYLKKLSIKLGPGSRLDQPLKLSNIGNVSIGKNSIILKGCVLDNRDKITIGNNVVIDSNVELKTSEPEINSPFFELQFNPITIEDNVHIQSNVIVKPGVTIKKGAVILSGSLVNKDVLEFQIFNGVATTKMKLE